MEASGTWSSGRPLSRRSLLPLLTTWRWLESERGALAWRSWQRALGSGHLYAHMYAVGGGRPDRRSAKRRPL